MNILLIDIDSQIPNIALHKVDMYHTQRGDCVKWNLPLWANWADKIYASCVFTENFDKCREWEGYAELGGSGYDVNVKLPLEIEAVTPRLNLGFTSRGCIRKCAFCIVPQKEGHIQATNDLLDLWNGEARDITLLDNNILALPHHFERVCKQARLMKIRVDFNQGLDHRLLNDDNIRLLKSIRHKGEFRFSFDDPDSYHTVDEAISLLEKHNIKRAFWYVLIGFNTTFHDDLSRFEFLRERNQTAFAQRYTKNRGNLLLGRWACQPAMFRKMTFWQFLGIPRNQKYYQKHKAEIDEYIQV